MYHNPGWYNVIHLIVYFQLLDTSLAGNYPSDPDNPKPCARRKNTFTSQVPLCQWDDKNNCYEKESEQNCGYWVKAECPELNKATCEEYEGRHCCKATYEAKLHTWMKIYYANQYSPTQFKEPVYDIVEIHRKVKDTDEFGEVEQPDYPENVLNPTGELGLKWVDVKDPKKPPSALSTNLKICKDALDLRCDDSSNDTSYGYLKNNYPDGFEKNFTIPMTQYENDTKAKIKITYESRCKYIIIKNISVPGCGTYYRRNAIPEDKEKAITSFIFLEAVLYNDASGKFNIRYAYWNLEDVKIRDTIFRDKNRHMGYVSDHQKV